MKLTIVVETIIMCAILTVFCIFTVDSVSVRKAEYTSILATEGQRIVENYFEEKLPNRELHQAFQTSFEKLSSSESDIKITVNYANAELGIVAVLIEITYKQPTGRPRMLSYNRVYIREKPDDANAEDQYSFVRTIDAKHYKTEVGMFVAESNGGLKEDSIWRTALYEAALDSVFLTSE